MRAESILSFGEPLLDELLGGLRRGSLVLIAGNPGTGKTIFSAQCTYRNVIDLGLKAVYVSMAEPKHVFYQCMQALGMDFKPLEDEGKFRFLDLASPMDPTLMEGMLEEALKEALSLKADLLVLDSLSAVLQLLGRERTRSLVHSLFTRVVRAAGITTIAIVEVPKGSKRMGFGVEEFIADVVLLLGRREIEARLGRELEIVKARGAEVKHPRLIYTLHGGFKLLPPMKNWRMKAAERFKPIEPRGDRYSTGITDLDEVLGGYPKGGVVYLEVGENIETSQYHLFAAPPLINFTAMGKGVIVFPSMGIDASVVYRVGKEYGLTDEEFKFKMRVVQPRALKTKELKERWLVEVEGRSFEDDYNVWLNSVRSLQESTGSHEVCAFMGADNIYYYYGEEPLYRFLSLESLRTRMEGGLLLVVTKPGLEPRIIKVISNVSNIHLKLVRRRGALLIYGIKPRTELYAVLVDLSKGYAMPKLIPVV